jgi:tetratricopeptide (TPR) repeat protein
MRLLVFASFSYYMNGTALPEIQVTFSLLFNQKIKIRLMKKRFFPTAVMMVLFVGMYVPATAQMMRMPDGNVNYKCKTGRLLGTTQIDISWNAPGVKDREGKIWGTDVAWYDFRVLGFGSNTASPWRAGADECTNISFSTDVTINGRPLAAGKYAFFIALFPDSCILIFNKNTAEWGSYFYNSQQDVMRVTARQQKDGKESKERLDYTFAKQTDHAVEVALEWERWRIPFTVEVDLTANTLAYIRSQMSGAAGFDPPSLETAATWCLQNKVNTEEALAWINTAVDPNLGGAHNFKNLSVKAGLLNQLNKKEEAGKIMKSALEKATVNELHNYGRQLLGEKKVSEAMEIFEMNYKKYNGAWPTSAGMMRGYSARGDLKKALEYGNKALADAPSAEIKKIIQAAVDTLSKGKAL